LTVGIPFLYIGPRESHISEIAAQKDAAYRAYTAINGDVESVILSIRQEKELKQAGQGTAVPHFADKFSRKALLPRLINLLEAGTNSEVPNAPEAATYVSAIR
jgi:hypothetical protein